MRTALAMATLLLLPACASAQAPEPPVMDGMFSYYDLDSYKGGEWVEYETSTETTVEGKPSRTNQSSWKTSCVGVDADSVLFETTTPLQAVAAWKGFTVLVAVDKKSGKVTKAWWGKEGETGKELKVTPSPEVPASSEVTGTGKVSRDTITVSGADYECEKIETDLVMKTGIGELKVKSSSWNSEKLPFHVKGFPDAAKAMVDKLTWESKPSGKGFMVKSESVMEKENYRSKSTTLLKGSGTDAKATLKR